MVHNSYFLIYRVIHLCSFFGPDHISMSIEVIAMKLHVLIEDIEENAGHMVNNSYFLIQRVIPLFQIFQLSN